ncbi:MAG: hypothetical protein LBV40_02710 [Methanomicrobiales archaeon]|nr:hypothetical protein [Methanomicrobiales archaeon]
MTTAVLSASRLALASKIRPYYWAIQYAPEQPFEGYATNGSRPQVLLLNFSPTRQARRGRASLEAILLRQMA